MALPLCFGCAKHNNDLGQVVGSVTLDGEPLADAFVEFVPREKGNLAYGKTDINGEYIAMFARDVAGASLGKNLVRISTYDLSFGGGGLKEKVPSRYNRDSDLIVTVDRGSNRFNFDLESAGSEIAQPTLGDDIRPDDLGTVHGTVTLNGQPLADATIELLPKSDLGTTSIGETDANGDYSVIYCCDIEGAPIGETLVRITKHDSLTGQIPGTIDVERVISVQAGSNEFDFELETHNGEILPERAGLSTLENDDAASSALSNGKIGVGGGKEVRNQ